MAEYYFTDKPQCYVIKSDKVIKTQLNTFGQGCISHAYNAYSEQDIIDFIESVVLSGNDVRSKERHDFWEQELKCNFPNATNHVLERIKKSILEVDASLPAK